MLSLLSWSIKLLRFENWMIFRDLKNCKLQTSPFTCFLFSHFSKWKCLDSRLLSGQGSIGYMHGWWVSRHGKEMTYWQGGNSTPYRCACGLTRSWADQRCGYNCDINDYVWREYRKLLTNMVELRSSDLIEIWWYRGSWRQWTRQPHPWKAEVLLHKLRVLKLYMSHKYKWQTECIKAKDQTSFKSVKRLESMVLKYKKPYLLKLNTASLCYY